MTSLLYQGLLLAAGKEIYAKIESAKSSSDAVMFITRLGLIVGWDDGLVADTHARINDEIIDKK